MSIKNKSIAAVLAFCAIGFQSVSAAMVDFTDNGNNVNLGSSFTEVNSDGVTIKVSAFSFAGTSNTPTASNTQNSIIEAFGNFGIGIGGGGNPQHTADNDGRNEIFLIEFSQNVIVNWASITEWGNNSGSTSGGDSDVDYWGGAGSFNFNNIGSRFNNNVNVITLGNGQQRTVNFSNGLGGVNWLLFGPDSNSGGPRDYIKLRKIDYDVAPVPLPAAVWLMGSALLGLAGFKRKIPGITS
ncbi:MAG: VPLPA-CTERM sorting domain-containing protein [Gammaproteobacteria bacterium]|nr:VPLPA-CTERM sorting domain-containing protein [Gammaproteobacteria bacterium]